MLRFFRPLPLVAALTGFLLVVAGCNQATDNPNVNVSEKPGESNTGPNKKNEEHPHKPGAHNGILVEIGRDNYHAEAVFEKDGVLRFYTRDKDETKIKEIEAEPITAYAKLEGATEATSVILKPEPQKGDKQGYTSQFVGKLPRELWGKPVEVNIPTLHVGDERFRVPPFKSASEGHADAVPPTDLNDEAERTLYLTPAGKYTDADVKANGNKTASQKYKGFQPTHDLKPKVGDRICPITLTKANPKCTWIVDGKEYQFCCPPCVEEFVDLAKTKPDEIKSPEEYVKK